MSHRFLWMVAEIGHSQAKRVKYLVHVRISTRRGARKEEEITRGNREKEEKRRADSRDSPGIRNVILAWHADIMALVCLGAAPWAESNESRFNGWTNRGFRSPAPPLSTSLPPLSTVHYENYDYSRIELGEFERVKRDSLTSIYLVAWKRKERGRSDIDLDREESNLGEEKSS